MADAWLICEVCLYPICTDPHSDPATGGDLHAQCCPFCTTGQDALIRRQLVAEGDRPVMDTAGVPIVLGHPGPTADQAARGEARAATRLEAP